MKQWHLGSDGFFYGVHRGESLTDGVVVAEFERVSATGRREVAKLLFAPDDGVEAEGDGMTRATRIINMGSSLQR